MHVNCWKQAYEPEFNFIDELDNLETKLLSLGILNGTSERHYESLSDDLSNGKIDERKLKEISAPKFVSKKPYLECNGEFYNPFDNKETLKYGLLFSLYLVKASEHAKIQIEIPSNNQINLNSKSIQLTELRDELLKAAEKLHMNEIPFDEIVISLEVASDVKLGIVSDIQQILRESELRKVLYSTTNSR